MNCLLAFVFFFTNSLLNKNQVSDQLTYSESEELIPCQRCGSTHTVKNGSIHNGKPKRHCKDCKRQFVVNPTNYSVSLERKQLIDKLLLEQISLRGIVKKNHIERLNNTFRQRISRLIRKSLSFSKKLDNHIGAIWYFIHDYNARLVRD